mmetsp:Transcript_24101/g.74288  ORF Transcript_24101/g.74288 Transcript_24101/m.74288 type:complete len:212 (+) Transcript_24101:1849-2484(+)|eukprot:CAMPEP_0198675888 /NCGR_PEP_ID=MMETSP1467-20131203/98641_1 /TAXON_ID=1462469 /ORGANISM="unid. sp., Strain CCMP2135" /LENGTH=211 /DNA_ID=CAMNT_0044412787 /DNA_START=2217 /DNA_END=2852 /DNA_ORIENTATION=-
MEHAREIHVFLTGTGTTDLLSTCDLGTSPDGHPILGFVTPGSGASWFFALSQNPHIVPNSRQQLAKPVLIYQGSTNVLATHSALLLVTPSDIRHPARGNVLLAPTVLLDNFRQDPILMSYGVFRAYNLLFTDPPHPHGYLVRLNPTQHSGFPFSVEDFPPSVPTVLLRRQPNNLSVLIRSNTFFRALLADVRINRSILVRTYNSSNSMRTF